MDVLPMCSIFQELQIVHDTGYFSALPSLEEYWQQVNISHVTINFSLSQCLKLVCGSGTWHAALALISCAAVFDVSALQKLRTSHHNGCSGARPFT